VKLLAGFINREHIAQKLTREGKPQEMLNTLWAMSSLGYSAKSLADAINREDVSEWLVREGKP